MLKHKEAPVFHGDAFVPRVLFAISIRVAMLAVNVILAVIVILCYAFLVVPIIIQICWGPSFDILELP